ncbi:hypothetical protein H3S80_08290 [Bartonella sp. M0177]|uniref:hypothetical protein n=1 Tax=Bartonella sp. M0177 TaxID=2750940 RepID=UPI0018DB8B06|nr:hypothetical protein [Bartonella sp. M0177]MBI0004045.1 hypothetical protein [Bartonella sp. M0177]
MKIFLTSLLIAITFILNITSTFAGTIADDDELKVAIRSFSRELGLANAQASNCSDEKGVSRVETLRTRGIKRFIEAGFPQTSVEAFDDFTRKAIEDEHERIGQRCDEESLQLFMRGAEREYKDLEDVLSRYVVPQ